MTPSASRGPHGPRPIMPAPVSMFLPGRGGPQPPATPCGRRIPAAPPSLGPPAPAACRGNAAPRGWAAPLRGLPISRRTLPNSRIGPPKTAQAAAAVKSCGFGFSKARGEKKSWAPARGAEKRWRLLAGRGSASEGGRASFISVSCARNADRRRRVRPRHARARARAPGLRGERRQKAPCRPSPVWWWESRRPAAPARGSPPSPAPAPRRAGPEGGPPAGAAGHA